MFVAALQQQYFGTSVAQWVGAALVTLVVTGILRTITRVIDARLSDSAPKTDSLVDDVVLDMARRTFFLFQFAMGVAAASWLLSVPDHWDQRIRTAVVLLAILQGGVWSGGIVNYLVIALLDRRGGAQDPAQRTGRAVLRSLGLAVVWATVLLLCLDNLGVSVTTLIAGLGVTGIAVALATQQITSDLFASVSILVDKPFVVGDFINVDTLYGTVDRIGVRSTRLRSLSGETIVFANSDLSKSRVRNFANLAERRVVFTFTLQADTKIDQALAVAAALRHIIENLPKTRFDRSHWAGFTDHGLSFEAVYYVLDGNYITYMDLQQAINAALLHRLRTDGVHLAAVGTPIRVLEPQLAVDPSRLPP